jgi:hypothetical protein
MKLVSMRKRGKTKRQKEYLDIQKFNERFFMLQRFYKNPPIQIFPNPINIDDRN